MPLYDFICECGHQFEAMVRLWDSGARCPQCESGKLYKLPSAPGGYSGDLGSASTKPRGAGSFKGRKPNEQK